MTENLTKQAPETWGKFLWKNTLNLYEYGTNIGYKLIIDIAFEDKIRAFGGNPVASSIIRDLTGLPSAMTAAWYSLNIGNSHIKNDIGNVMFSTTKITCKSAMIISYVYFVEPEAFHNKGKLDLVGRAGNYVCEPLGGIFRQVTIERQETNNTDVDYFSYMYQNAKIDWLYKAFVGGLPKVFVQDLVGEGFKYMAYKDGVKGISNNIDMTVKNYFLPSNENDMTIKDDIWSRFAKVVDTSNWLSYPAAAIIFATNVVEKIVEDVVPSFSICTTARCTQSYIEQQAAAQLVGNSTAGDEL